MQLRLSAGKAPMLTGYWWRGREQRSRGVGLSRASGARSRNDLLHQRRLLSTAVLFTLLPLSVVVVERRRQDCIREHPAAEREAAPGQKEPPPCSPSRPASGPAAFQDARDAAWLRPPFHLHTQGRFQGTEGPVRRLHSLPWGRLPFSKRLSITYLAATLLGSQNLDFFTLNQGKTRSIC